MEGIAAWTAALVDDRIRAYARLLVHRCIGARPGWQVVVSSQVAARPLVEEVQRQLGEAGAYAILQLSFDTAGGPWTRAAPDDLLATPSRIFETIQSEGDAFISIMAPENTRDAADISPERGALIGRSAETLRARITAMDCPWVACQFPTAALAQDASMTPAAFADFLFEACLLDWDAEADRMRRLADRFDAATEVRLVGPGTDLLLGVEGRECAVDDGHINLPGGEVFLSPLEDATEGLVTFSEFPAVYHGHEVGGAWLRFEGGRVVDAGAATNEEFLFAMLDTDDGARVLGELGIGCNPRITRHMKNTLFDEKIDGTVHLALGRSYTVTGGTNESAIHWDIVKDLRVGAELQLDGDVVQRDGSWLLEAVDA
jgi:aminopeptidase